MFENWTPTALLVHGAALCYVMGFLVREQLVLRSLMQVGCIFYIAYYYLEPDTPLWDAIAWTAVMFVANAWTIARILKDRRFGHFNEDDLVIFNAIQHMTPGDFRRLIAIAHKGTTASDTQITKEGGFPEALSFVVSGDVTIDKRGAARSLRAPIFVGEVSFLLEQPASATVTLPVGTRYIYWSTAELRKVISKYPTIGTALEAAFNRDLAVKVAAS